MGGKCWTNGNALRPTANFLEMDNQLLLLLDHLYFCWPLSILTSILKHAFSPPNFILFFSSSYLIAFLLPLKACTCFSSILFHLLIHLSWFWWSCAYLYLFNLVSIGVIVFVIMLFQCCYKWYTFKGKCIIINIF